MSKSNKKKHKISATEASATQQAAANAKTEITQQVAPETLLSNHQPPQPNYPSYRVKPGERISLAEIDPNQSEDYQTKKDIKKKLKREKKRLATLQERFYAENKRSLLIVLQSMDTGGKDGTIKHVFQGINPQGCRVWSFKMPSQEEASHDFLWRYHQRAPKQGMITIFNRSHYEDVLIVRVKNLVPEEDWRKRYDTINQFEQMLTLDNITVIKFFLHISKDEQKWRLERRLKNMDKRWKFSKNDIQERKYWDEYQAAFEEAINNCSTEYAPWYVIPANKKWYRNLAIARILADTLAAMNPQFPEPELDLDNIIIQ
ncbi:polyphosphate kinase 2 family protein [Oscillatoria salina]|uniref:polyphosphate kinase 2 family protein n=1 Tax=Oscillatoria salina TaxID=331517 RepID=UPI0013B656ED|nr:polyphosphate kinase 2 family protein [Oscillatoria salina]MBZ8179419.1 polyphosphate kinase 2 family protein [Oscillatoria salina IIICB1]NET87841.1 polyphosphate kinase 2 family protein [Kamptonema sp. SIO1D9]